MRVLIGPTAVWLGGWTGQVSWLRHVATPASWVGPPAADEAGVRCCPFRMRRIRAVAVGGDPGLCLPPRLPAAMALADGIMNGNIPVTPPDEIDPDYMEGDEVAELIAAFKHFGADRDTALDLARPYLAVLRNA